eukprot:5463477-Amphidinium_carterae.2
MRQEIYKGHDSTIPPLYSFTLHRPPPLSSSTLYPLPGACACGCSRPLRLLYACTLAGQRMHITMAHSFPSEFTQLSTHTCFNFCHHYIHPLRAAPLMIPHPLQTTDPLTCPQKQQKHKNTGFTL